MGRKWNAVRGKRPILALEIPITFNETREFQREISNQE